MGQVCLMQYSIMDDENFAKMVQQKFPSLFQKVSTKKRCLFLQDGDPSQNSAKARRALEDRGYWIFSIPARSPDLNPIENLFHLVGKQIKKDGMHIESETYAEFVKRCRATLLNYPPAVIDKTIESMPKRLKLVIERDGQRIKY